MATSEYIYDELNRLTELRQPFGGTGGGISVTTYGYDVQDHLNQIIDAEGRFSNYLYSDRDLLMEEVSEISGTTVYTYNEHGTLATRTDARGITETRTIDELDRMTFLDFADDALDISFSYDDPDVAFSTGRLTRNERGDFRIDYPYDRFGRTVQDGQLHYAYDLNGNRTRIIYPDGEAAVFSYDYTDRPSTLRVEVPGEPDRSIVMASSYEPSGPLSSLTLGNGLSETRIYDTRYFPASIAVGDGVTTILDWQYTNDTLGNPNSIIDGLDISQNRTFGYQDYQYFMTQGDGPWGFRSWEYDQIGNRLVETKDGTTDTYTYVPNAANGNSPQLDHIDLGSGGQRTFQYDVSGNQTKISTTGSTIHRTYDETGRMALQEFPTAQASTTFKYDGRGLLGEAVGISPHPVGTALFCDGFESGDTSAWGTSGGTCVTSETTAPIYSSSGQLHLRDQALILYFAGSPVALRTEIGAWLYLTRDHLGNPILATDSTAAEVWQGGFEPFGLDYTNASASGVFLRLPGQWDDDVWQLSAAQNALSENLQRWYQPNVGSYSRPDPLGLRGDPHPYQYGLGNPLSFFDPFGLYSVDSACICSASDGDTPGTGLPGERLKREVDTICSQLEEQITDPKLRQCLKKSCDRGRIRCRTACGLTRNSGRPILGLGGGLELGRIQFKSRTATLCLDNISFDSGPGALGEIVLHEWAHGCSWDHVNGTTILDGKGVPGPDGTLSIE